MADYHISDIYQGGYSSLEPNYGNVFTGYHMPLVNSIQPTITGDKISQGTRLGVSTDPRTANVLKEVSEKLSAGQKIVELSAIDLGSPLEAIPKQHWDELRRLSKLTGVEVTVHGPITDASGFGERDFTEQQRELVERKLFQAMERSHQINPEGNVPVTFHTSNRLPGPTWQRDENGKIQTIVMPVVNVETGQVNQVKRDVKYYPWARDKNYNIIPVEQGKVYGVEEQIKIMNTSDWDNNLQQMIVPKEHADRILRETYPLVRDVLQMIEEKKINPEDLTDTQKAYYSRFLNAHEQLRDVETHLQSIFSKGYEHGDERTRIYLKEVAEQFRKDVLIPHPQAKILIENPDPMVHSKALQNLMNHLRIESFSDNKVSLPELYKPSEEFALEKTAQTFGNVAWESYKKFGKNSPIVQIENPPAGGGLSRGEDLKNVVEKAQKKFIEIAKENGMSEEKASEEAKKLIGVTWDVGHINQLRKYGFTGKDIIEEAGKVSHLVKHIHLSDNFGLDNVELPMGMGNVDFKEVMAKLGKKGEEARKIVEAAHWWQFQQSSPVGVSMEALGSPIYAMKQSPYWNQVSGFQQGYFGGYGAFLPQINYETFGAGFSNLPNELGGQRGQTGGRGRMSGTPME